MKRISTLLAILTVTIAATAQRAYTPADVPNVHVENRTHFVSNPDGIISPATVDSLNAALATIWDITSAEPVVAVIGQMAPDYDIDSFATDLFSLWGIGKKDNDNGLLILVSTGDRRVVIRPGYGLEGLLPDAVCGRILDNAMPDFRRGDYGAGVEKAVSQISEILLRPEARDEILSQYKNDAGTDEDTDFLYFMLKTGCVFLVVMLVWIAVVYYRSRKEPDVQRYRKLQTVKYVSLFLTFLGLGIPVVAFLICMAAMNHVRNHKRRCPNCGEAMHKVDEEHDNDYLTPAQDMEERINSVDYDVWLCDNCGERDIVPYRNRQTVYTQCPQCGAVTLEPIGNRIIMQPTTTREGRGEHLYGCRNCHCRISKPYTIAKLATPVVIFPGGGRGGFGGGGGFSGGSFGGGMTGGGGASRGW